MRTSGILLPVSSLPTRYGIGGFSDEAFAFVDQLEKAGQSWWQVLPLGPTGYGDSPYQSFSTFAGNPYYISLDKLREEGLLTSEECEEADCGQNPEYVDYEKIYFSRFLVLKKAYQRFSVANDQRTEFEQFCEASQDWLDDYALYMAIKNSQDGKAWSLWPEGLRDRDPDALKKAAGELEDEVDFYRFLQFIFAKQWNALRSYANQKGIGIIGDIPIYVAMDSADCWAGRELFQFDADGRPSGVAGCPPDAFSADGQLWGNPLYDWDYHKRTGYSWWIRRLRKCAELYDMVRIDHFRGFAGYYSIPYGAENARNGHWEKGPGMDLFRAVRNALGEQNYIAEDLGFLTDDVIEMVRQSGYPGMKVLEFAFDGDPDNVFLPHHYDHNCVVYTGTHDNETVVGWYHRLGRKGKAFAKKYLGHRIDPQEDFVRLAMSSVADLAVIPLQDYLGLGNEARINFPSTVGDNWKWRMLPGQLDAHTVEKIRELTELYSRLPDKSSRTSDDRKRKKASAKNTADLKRK
ncbi:MAG: 4-alpha-glucanotransferase [Bilifractor sp.]